MTSRSPKLLIVDQSLRDMAGHHYEYDLALYRGAMGAGIPAVIGAHMGVQQLDQLDNVRPWFEKAWYEPQAAPPDAPARRLPWLPQPIRTPLGRIARAVVGPQAPPAEPPSSFGTEVLALIHAETLSPGDHVLVHTVSLPELDSLIAAVADHDGLPRIHVLLRRDAAEPAIASSPNGGIRGSLERIASSLSATLRLYTDTEELAQQHRALAPGIEVGVLPIPHCLDPAGGRASPPAPPLRIAYLGDARSEKGFHLLADLVDAVAKRLFPQRRARFLIQGNVSVAGDSPELETTRRRLAAYRPEQVELITEQLDLAAFHDLVRSSHIVLLPYDRDAYARRSSGIMIQALAAGCVMVVPAGTWMARRADPTASVTFENEAGLAGAVLAAVDRWPALAGAAQRNAAGWHAEHNAMRYLTQLLQPVTLKRS